MLGEAEPVIRKLVHEMRTPACVVAEQKNQHHVEQEHNDVQRIDAEEPPDEERADVEVPSRRLFAQREHRDQIAAQDEEDRDAVAAVEMAPETLVLDMHR